tara:strand:- start:677 stop:1618 length:942 start_codon:yes stop_codon:yes gene_type:complete
MRQFLSKLLIFLSPLIIYFLIVLIIDPFNIFQNYSRNKNSIVKQICNRVNPHLSKLSQFKNNPSEIVFLGDSKVQQLPINRYDTSDQLSKINLSYGGGNIFETIETFNYVVDNFKPKVVIVGVNFHNFNLSYSHNRVKKVAKIFSNPLAYLMSRDVLLFFTVYLKNFFIDGNHAQPKSIKIINNNDKWNIILQTIDSYYSYYEYPDSIIDKMIYMEDYCKKNNIELVLFIPPIHIDLISKVKEYGISEEYENFKKFIYSFETVYDFNNPNDISINKINFTDPYHSNKKISEIIVDELNNYESKYKVRKVLEKD